MEKWESTINKEKNMKRSKWSGQKKQNKLILHEKDD